MTIGVIVAMAEEINSLLGDIGTPVEVKKEPGFEVRVYEIKGNRVCVIGSGVGEISAAMTVQYLISACKAEKIVNFGVVGGLNPEMKLKKTCVVERAVHYDFDASPFWTELKKCQYPQFSDKYIPAFEEEIKMALEACPELIRVTCASADKFVDAPEDKKKLFLEHKADICDMETAGILLTCHRNEVPAVLIKSVSDAADKGAEEFANMISEAAKECVAIVLKMIEAI